MVVLYLDTLAAQTLGYRFDPAVIPESPPVKERLGNAEFLHLGSQLLAKDIGTLGFCSALGFRIWFYLGIAHPDKGLVRSIIHDLRIRILVALVYVYARARGSTGNPRADPVMAANTIELFFFGMCHMVMRLLRLSYPV